jgi:hypothetical protein
MLWGTGAKKSSPLQYNKKLPDVIAWQPPNYDTPPYITSRRKSSGLMGVPFKRTS